jgi:hypothetical protein
MKFILVHLKIARIQGGITLHPERDELDADFWFLGGWAAKSAARLNLLALLPGAPPAALTEGPSLIVS